MKEEIWKDIKCYEGCYQISDKGRVKSLARSFCTPHGGIYFQDDKFLSQGNVNGYKIVALSGKTTSVHRLVGIQFLPNPGNKKQINHIDGNKSNNNVNNLEWATSKENHIHAVKTGLRKFKTGQSHQNSKLVLNTVTGIYYETMKEAWKSTNIKEPTFAAMMSGRHPNRTNFIYV
jgi:hypothetical protein